jgi:hypothetical protein
MSKIKEREYVNYDDKDDGTMMDDDAFIDTDLDISEQDEGLLSSDNIFRAIRTWRDTEKYREMRELYKIINDELYTGFYEEEFIEEDE